MIEPGRWGRWPLTLRPGGSRWEEEGGGTRAERAGRQEEVCAATVGPEPMSNALIFTAEVGSMIGMQPVDLVGIQLDPAPAPSVLVLREHEAPPTAADHRRGRRGDLDRHRRQRAAPARPLTHDLMATLVDSFDAHVDAAEVTELRDGSFLAKLAVSGPTGERRLDTRPSDAIALAVRLDAPLFVSERVLDEAGPLPIVELDEDEIDARGRRLPRVPRRARPRRLRLRRRPPTGPSPATGRRRHPDGETRD